MLVKISKGGPLASPKKGQPQEIQEQ